MPELPQIDTRARLAAMADEAPDYEPPVEDPRAAMRRNLRGAGLLHELPDQDLDLVLSGALERRDVTAVIETWYANASALPYGEPLLVACGPTQIGKTLAAASLLARHGGVYVVFEQFVREYSRYLRDTSVSDRSTDVLERYWGDGLLVLDELGTEEARSDVIEAARVALQRLVDRRRSRGRTLTLILSNLELSQLAEAFRDGRYDQRTHARIQLVGLVEAVRGDVRGRRR